GFELAPGEIKGFNFKSYNGPKIISQLDAFNPTTSKVMHLSWGPMDYLARLLLWILVKFNDVLHSYGWSIICLTIVVRLLFYPVTAKANASMKKMQQVQQQLTALREKYKDNPQLLNTKMMELYRQEGVNPFGGCLPILLQIPVFFALYATLDGAVELRQVAFWWCKDLAAADTVAKIPLYFFDLPINPLVLAMTLLMAIQQRMTPMSGDPMQKKMMMMMPGIMLIFLYDLPSGLTLYWTVSNLFSIVQLMLQQRAGKKAAATAK
ncbi:MAG: membrane protein insertase YidC, partial [Lentisphaeria bacterium]|nr:membrane protein insertase YidC [Lentisphaeria bacterium]